MSDSVVRAMTQDGSFRVIAALTTETVQGAVQAQRVHGAQGARAGAFGELLTGAILVREAMAPKLRVQAILKSKARGGSMIADSQPDGTSRGLVRFGAGDDSADAAFCVESCALLQVMRSLPNGAVHQGVVQVPGGSISAAFMQYMQDSEQIVTSIAVSAILEGDQVVLAGGYLLQLLPEASRGPLMVMTERLAELPDAATLLRASPGCPDALLDELLYGMPFARLEDSPLAFSCSCSHVRLVASLSTLPRADVEDLIREGEVLEIVCDYCGKLYHIPPAQLHSLLTPS